jgi:hypothetical protein
LVNSLLIFWKNLYCQHVGENPSSNFWIGRRCDAATGNACYWPGGQYGDNRGTATNGYGAAEEQCALGVDDEVGQITETLKHKRFDNSKGDNDIVTLDLPWDKIQDKFKDKDIPFDFDEMTGDIYEIGKVTHNYKEEGRFKINKLTEVHGEDIALDAKTDTCGSANKNGTSLNEEIKDTMEKFTSKPGNNSTKKFECVELYDQMVKDNKLTGLN